MFDVATPPLISERKHPRVEAGFMVRVYAEGTVLLAKALDVSMAGLRLVGVTAPVGRRLEVALPLPDDREVRTPSVVVRGSDDGVAVEFERLDWDDLFALARFLHPRLP